MWHWLNKGGLPTLSAWLSISLHGGIGLEKLFTGDIDNWVLPVEPIQMRIPLLESPRKGIKSREKDWEAIRAQLQSMLDEPTPISLREACERVETDHKNLYQRANAEARAIADRFRRHQASARQARLGRLSEQVGVILQDRREAGFEGLSAREVWQRIDDDVKSVRHTYRHIDTAIAAND